MNFHTYLNLFHSLEVDNFLTTHYYLHLFSFWFLFYNSESVQKMDHKVERHVDQEMMVTICEGAETNEDEFASDSVMISSSMSSLCTK